MVDGTGEPLQIMEKLQEVYKMKNVELIVQLKVGQQFQMQGIMIKIYFYGEFRKSSSR